MALPAIVFELTDSAAANWRFWITDWKWEGKAFIIVATMTVIYRLFLNRLY